MRLYSICNMYLSSIQNGIQTQHSTVRLFRKYENQNDKDGNPVFEKDYKYLDLIYDWADNHETTIVVNGGATEHMVAMIPLIEATGLPWAPFYEPGIGDALTSISVIVPARLYDADLVQEHRHDWCSKLFGTESHGKLTAEEYAFISKLKSMPLAK